MKTLKFLVIGVLLLFTGAVQAQFEVNISIGSPPLWGPFGYSDVRYYYLPDVESYYDVQTSMFIYFDEGEWLYRAYLPSRYSNYDLFGGYKVVMSDYHGNTPFHHFHEHKKKYWKGYRGASQRNIGYIPEHRNSKENYNDNDQGGKKIIHVEGGVNKGNNVGKVKSNNEGKVKSNNEGNRNNKNNKHKGGDNNNGKNK